jgi:hypothetical protein
MKIPYHRNDSPRPEYLGFLGSLRHYMLGITHFPLPRKLFPIHPTRRPPSAALCGQGSSNPCQFNTYGRIEIGGFLWVSVCASARRLIVRQLEELGRHVDHAGTTNRADAGNLGSLKEARILPTCF